MLFADRIDAGRRLAERLGHLRDADPVVLALPRGGVPVAYQVAEALDAPLDVIVVRKLGVPFQPELGMGAIGEDGVRIVNPEVVRAARVTDDEIAAVERRERAELERRARRFRGDRPRVPLEGRTAIVVDDGIATGSTARAACQVARAHGAARVVLAVPVAPPGWTDRLGDDADDLVCLETPEQFWAIGQWYGDFTQTSDGEVVDLLERRAGVTAGSGSTGAPGFVYPAGGGGDPPGVDAEVELPAGPVRLAGRLTIPGGATGIVVFAHGSGSSRHSPRNQYVAGVRGEAGMGTLLFDLLSVAEEVDRANVFDIDLLARRLTDATRWLRERPEARDLPVGYFGASTGAAAALWAAADLGPEVAAVVSRGGRPDLAGARLADVAAPTLLVVGGHDEVVLDLNRRAQAQMRCETRLAVVPGATHLFEEPGTLQQAAALARDWFVEHLASVRPPAGR
ncbi:MAG TPA: phosphoribosyltransferase family protein [Acidimicrobiales bacterium]|nr:phosphoribosyltransferase family protein [Acidimicrobiales bacterium]